MINKKIINIASNTKYHGLRNIFTHKSQNKNKTCGDMIKMEINIKNKKIRNMRYETESCILCEASASILAKKINKFSLKTINEDMQIMSRAIKEKQYKLPVKFKDFRDVVNSNNLNRIDCVMLPFKTLLKAFKKTL